MGEPRAITYKEVVRTMGTDAGAGEVWRQIGEAVGAGHVPLNADGDASIGLTGASDAKRAQVDKIVADATVSGKLTKDGK